MRSSAEFLSPSEAAKKLGVSTKALRLYEQRGLIAPIRTEVGWRAYGPKEMDRAAEIVGLRSIGFSLAQIDRVLNADAEGLEEALAAHQATLETRLQDVSDTVGRVRGLRDDLAAGRTPTAGELTRMLAAAPDPVLTIDLPWPWGGEQFELQDIRPLNYIIGPLFSGKTKLAQRLAEMLPGAAFLGLDRLADDGTAAQARLVADPDLKSRVDQVLDWLVEDGASPSDALIALLAALEAEGPDIWVIDMVEQDLDEESQRALIAYLRRRGADATPLFLITRSCEILDLASVGAHEAIILCPANHSVPTYVAPHAGANGYDAVATCLAPPEVRARTEGVIAWRPTAE